MKRTLVLLSVISLLGAGCANQTSLIDGTWKFASVQQGESLVMDLSSLDMSVTFDESKHALNATMCNDIRGDYEIDKNDVIASKNAIATKMLCDGDKGLAETAFVTNLATGFKIGHQNESLTLVVGSTTFILDKK